jgi:mono/diheme cytochrome c family protein
MPNGQGAQGAGAYPALANDPHLASAGYAIGLVLHGHADMPAFSRTLTNRQIADVLTYLRQNFGNDERDPITEADVQAAR